MLWNKRWNPTSEKFNQQIIPLNKNFIIAFEEIVIFKFYYQDDNQKKGTSTGGNEGTNVSVSTPLLSKDKKNQQSIKKHYDNPKRSIFEKKQQQEQWRRAEEGTSEEQPKDMRKYIKDLNDAYIVFCQFLVFLAYCCLKNGIIRLRN